MLVCLKRWITEMLWMMTASIKMMTGVIDGALTEWAEESGHNTAALCVRLSAFYFFFLQPSVLTQAFELEMLKWFHVCTHSWCTLEKIKLKYHYCPCSIYAVPIMVFSLYRVHTVFEGLWKFGGNGISFSRPWKSVKTKWGLWRFVTVSYTHLTLPTNRLV